LQGLFASVSLVIIQGGHLRRVFTPLYSVLGLVVKWRS